VGVGVGEGDGVGLGVGVMVGMGVGEAVGVGVDIFSSVPRTCGLSFSVNIAQEPKGITVIKTPRKKYFHKIVILGKIIAKDLSNIFAIIVA